MGRIKNRQNLFDGFLFLENLLLSFQNTKSHQKPYGHGKNSHNNPRATDLRPYAVLAFSAALHPARDKVPRRTDFPLRRAPPYFLSTGRENVREPHSPWLFFAQMVKRHACGFFFVLFLSAKKKDKGFLPFPKGGMVSFSCSPGKRTKRMRDRSGRSDLCEGFAFTRCSRHVFAQASLCKPRRNTQRDNKVHLLFFAPACAGEFCGLCLRAGTTCD